METLRTRIVKVFEENGIMIDDFDTILEFDSLTFISIIVCLENEFNIIFPDDFFSKINMMSINMYCEMINKLMHKEDKDED